MLRSKRTAKAEQNNEPVEKKAGLSPGKRTSDRPSPAELTFIPNCKGFCVVQIHLGNGSTID